MTILAIHRQEPNWPADRPRFAVVCDGTPLWAETDGDSPSLEDVRAVLKYGTTDVTAHKAALLASVDAKAAEIRARMTTPGMDLIYAEKFAQAQAVEAMGKSAADSMSEADQVSQFPLLAASVGVEAPTLYTVAELVLLKYAQFAQSSMGIERARLSGKKAIAQAQTIDAANAAYEAVTWPNP